jgi:NADPH:quinone reductase-like Zn-dependent oxidoreductase
MVAVDGADVRYYHFPRFGGVASLRLGERDMPVPGARQVLVAMRAWSLNYRDLLIADDAYGRALKPDLVPLSDGAGEVVEVGDEVTRWRAGDRVAGIFMPNWIAGAPTARRVAGALGASVDGVLAEYVVFDEQAVVAAPDHLDFAETATLPCAAVTAWHATVVLGRLAPGQSVLTLGTGGVSLFAVQIAVAGGARVLGTSSSDAKLARLRQLGVANTLNYATPPTWGAAVAELTGGGVDHVVEVGGAGTIAQSIVAARIGGRVSVIGVLSQGSGLDHGTVLRKGLTVQGMFVGSGEMFDAMNGMLAQHRIHPVIDRAFPFTEAPAAFRHFASRRHFGKVVIVAG